MFKKSSLEDYQHKFRNEDGPIYNKLQSKGLTHENFIINKSQLPDENSIEFNGQKMIGRGAERKVYYDPISDSVKKYPSIIETNNIGAGVITKTSHFDRLIESFERIMELRIFARVVNAYNQWYLSKNPDKISEIPIVAVPDSTVDLNAIIHEPLLPNNREKITNYKQEILKFLPKIKKDFFHFDMFGSGNVYKSGFTKEGRPIYHVIDGAKALKGRMLNDPHFKSIFENIEKQELERVFNQIDQLFSKSES
jgi:uncharacterized protein YdcH (DUF465 family)